MHCLDAARPRETQGRHPNTENKKKLMTNPPCSQAYRLLQTALWAGAHINYRYEVHNKAEG